MPITMYNKKTQENVKVYGFVRSDTGMYGQIGTTYAVTYRPNIEKSWEALAKKLKHEQFECTPEDLELKLVPASDLRPLDI